MDGVIRIEEWRRSLGGSLILVAMNVEYYELGYWVYIGLKSI